MTLVSSVIYSPPHVPAHTRTYTHTHEQSNYTAQEMQRAEIAISSSPLPLCPREHHFGPFRSFQSFC